MNSVRLHSHVEEHVACPTEVKHENVDIQLSADLDVEAEGFIKHEMTIKAEPISYGTGEVSTENIPEELKVEAPLSLQINRNEVSLLGKESLRSGDFAYAISGKVSAKPKKLYKCRKCPFTCYIERHYLSHHRYHMRVYNQCEQCGCETRGKTSYKSHMRKHRDLFPCHSHLDTYEASANSCKTSAKEVKLELPITEDYVKEETVAWECEYLNKSYKCKDCEFVSSEKDSLRLHVKETHPPIKNYIYKCSFCSYSAWKLSAFTRHRRNHRKRRKEKRFVCECGFRTATKFTFKLHTKRHEEQKKCDFCGYTGRGLRLQKHLKRHEKEKKCDCCEYRGGEAQLKRHLKTHIHVPILGKSLTTHESAKSSTKEEKIYRCNTCLYWTKSTHYLKIHEMIHTGEKPYSCGGCEYRTSSKSRLKHHENTVHNVEGKQKIYRCQKCCFSTSRKYGLTLHVRLHSGEKPYLCCKCGYQTAHLVILKQHEELAHMDGQHACKENGCADKLYSCTRCEYHTARKYRLFSHERTVHSKPKAFQCQLCDYSATERSGFTRHSLRHTPRKSYKCTDRDFNTFYGSRLDVHRLTVHEGGTPYQCANCDYSTTIKMSLEYHMKTHFGKKYLCDECDYKCITQNRLKKHQNRRHPKQENLIESTVNSVKK